MVSSFKKTEVKLDLLTDIGILLMVEKGIKKGKYHVINRHVKLITNIWQILIRMKNRHILNIGM